MGLAGGQGGLRHAGGHENRSLGASGCSSIRLVTTATHLLMAVQGSYPIIYLPFRFLQPVHISLLPLAVFIALIWQFRHDDIPQFTVHIGS